MVLPLLDALSLSSPPVGQSCRCMPLTCTIPPALHQHHIVLSQFPLPPVIREGQQSGHPVPRQAEWEKMSENFLRCFVRLLLSVVNVCCPAPFFLSGSCSNAARSPVCLFAVSFTFYTFFTPTSQKAMTVDNQRHFLLCLFPGHRLPRPCQG